MVVEKRLQWVSNLKQIEQIEPKCSRMARMTQKAQHNLKWPRMVERAQKVQIGPNGPEWHKRWGGCSIGKFWKELLGGCPVLCICMPLCILCIQHLSTGIICHLLPEASESRRRVRIWDICMQHLPAEVSLASGPSLNSFQALREKLGRKGIIKPQKRLPILYKLKS